MPSSPAPRPRSRPKDSWKNASMPARSTRRLMVAIVRAAFGGSECRTRRAPLLATKLGGRQRARDVQPYAPRRCPTIARSRRPRRPATDQRWSPRSRAARRVDAATQRTEPDRPGPRRSSDTRNDHRRVREPEAPTRRRAAAPWARVGCVRRTPRSQVTHGAILQRGRFARQRRACGLTQGKGQSRSLTQRRH